MASSSLHALLLSPCLITTRLTRATCFQLVPHQPLTYDGGSAGERDSQTAFRDALLGVTRREEEATAEGTEGSEGSIGCVDGDKACALAMTLPADLSAESSVGAVLAAVLLSCGQGSCSVPVGGEEAACGQAAGARATDDEEETAAAASAASATAGAPVNAQAVADAVGALSTALREVEQACDGLRAPTAMRQAAVEPLAVAQRLLEPLSVLGVHSLLATAAADPPSVASGGLGATLGSWGASTEPPSSTQLAAGWGRERPLGAAASVEERCADFAMLTRLWEVLKLEPSLAQRRLEVGTPFVLALLGSQPAAAGIVARLEEHVSVLQAEGPTLLGSAVAGLDEVPPHLRGQLISQIHVLCRLRGETPSLETPAAVRAYLQSCDGLLTKLTGEWWAVEGLEPAPAAGGEPRWVGRELRPAYVKK